MSRCVKGGSRGRAEGERDRTRWLCGYCCYYSCWLLLRRQQGDSFYTLGALDTTGERSKRLRAATSDKNGATDRYLWRRASTRIGNRMHVHLLPCHPENVREAPCPVYLDVAHASIRCAFLHLKRRMCAAATPNVGKRA